MPHHPHRSTRIGHRVGRGVLRRRRAASPHVRRGRRGACRIGPAPAAESYLRRRRSCSRPPRAPGADAIHPGYGFLVRERRVRGRASRPPASPSSARRPSRSALFGAQARGARRWPRPPACRCCRAPTLLADVDARGRPRPTRSAIPVMLKSDGRRRRHRHAACARRRRARATAFARPCSGAAQAASATPAVFLERYVAHARHVEVQVFGDGDGHGGGARRARLLAAAPQPEGRRGGAGARASPRRRARARCATPRRAWPASVHYRSAGTVEFVYDADRGDVHFLEVNTRLQVEHGVTEEVTGIDLVEWMVRARRRRARRSSTRAAARAARATRSRRASTPRTRRSDFRPSAGLLTEVHFPADVRVDTWVEPAPRSRPYYDPLLAKMIVHGADRAPTRSTALRRRARRDTRSHGIETNLDLPARRSSPTPAFVGGDVTHRARSSGSPYTAATRRGARRRRT